MKNNWFRIGLIVLLLATMGIAVTACGGDSPLVGKWQYGDEEEYYMEFFSDGKMEMGDESSTVSCTWEETGDTEITVTMLSIDGEDLDEELEVVLEYSISGDDLTLDDGEDPVVVTRVK